MTREEHRKTILDLSAEIGHKLSEEEILSQWEEMDHELKKTPKEDFRHFILRNIEFRNKYPALFLINQCEKNFS